MVDAVNGIMAIETVYCTMIYQSSRKEKTRVTQRRLNNFDNFGGYPKIQRGRLGQSNSEDVEENRRFTA